MPDADTSLPAPGDFSLVRSQQLLRFGTQDPCLRIEGNEVWRATWTPDGPASFRARQADGHIEVHAWGDGSNWVLERAARLLGLADDPHAFVPDHDSLRRLHARLPVYLPQTLRLFERLVPTILHQLVTWKEAVHAYRGMVEERGEPAPGPSPVRLPPTARTLARTAYYALSGHGVLKRQSDTIRRAATTIARLDAEVFDAQTLAARLEAIPGVGPWTAQATLAGVLGDPDAVLTGDLHLPHTISWALAGEARGDDARMIELLEPFRGHRWRVVTLIRARGITAPRRGPRMGMQAHRRMRGA